MNDKKIKAISLRQGICITDDILFTYFLEIGSKSSLLQVKSIEKISDNCYNVKAQLYGETLDFDVYDVICVIYETIN